MTDMPYGPDKYDLAGRLKDDVARLTGVVREWQDANPTADDYRVTTIDASLQRANTFILGLLAEEEDTIRDSWRVISGTDMARTWPDTAVRLVLNPEADQRNAWEVLASAFGAGRAITMVREAQAPASLLARIETWIAEDAK